jgi:hypothetical protein
LLASTLFLQSFEKIKDVIFFPGTGQIIIFRKLNCTELAALYAGAAETAGGKIKMVLGQCLFLFTLRFFTGKSDAA